MPGLNPNTNTLSDFNSNPYSKQSINSQNILSLSRDL